jgi:hypothetical protein
VRGEPVEQRLDRRDARIARVVGREPAREPARLERRRQEWHEPVDRDRGDRDARDHGAEQASHEQRETRAAGGRGSC